MSVADTGYGEREEPDLTYDTVFFTLSNARRRFVLHHLKQVAEPIAVGELAAQVAAWENGIPRTQVSNRQRKRVYTALHQTHLPKLHDLGIVEYDRGRGVVHPVGSLPRIDYYMEISPENDLPWHEYYLALAAFSLALVAAVWTGAYPFALVPEVWYGAAISVAFLVSAAVHTRRAQRYRLGKGGLPPSLEGERE
jgi:hypothetical protein